MQLKTQEIIVKYLFVASFLIVVALVYTIYTEYGHGKDKVNDTQDISEQPIFVSSNSDRIENLESLFDNFTFETSKVNKVIHKNNKYYSVNSVNIQGKNNADNTDEVNIAYKVGLDGTVCDLAISLQNDEPDTTKVLEVLNKFILADISDEVNTVISSSNTDKVTKQLGNYGKIEFVNKPITVEGLEFSKDADHDIKVENYKAQLIESGTLEDEVNSINTDELFGSYKEYSKSKNLIILGITLNSDSVTEVDRVQFTVGNNNCIMNSGTINIVSTDTYQEFINAVGAQEFNIEDIEIINDSSIVINSTIGYGDYKVPCVVNINDHSTTIEFNTNKTDNYDEFIENLSNILKSIYNIEEQIEVKSLPEDSEKYFEYDNCKVSVNLKYNSDDTYEANIKSVEYYKE